MVAHPCYCLYIDPSAIENLAKAGVGNAQVTANQDKLLRRKRNAKEVSTEALVGTSTAGAAPRKVYDCGHQWEQRVEPVVRDEGGPAHKDDAVNNVYDYAGQVRDFFRNNLNRNSYDNLGSDLHLNVHFGENYNNAFWDGDELTFGDGDGDFFVDLTGSLDVVAHEFGHGVTQFTANLDYYSQSGALNESFSDVFGSAITQHVLGQDTGEADWLVGNEIMGPELYGEALRSMKAPGTARDHPTLGRDRQPDHMDNYYAGPDDSQGVHINSGIPNKAFYLVSTTIGTDKALLIWYHALQNLWPTAFFNNAVAVIVESARILTKDGQVPFGSTQTVRSAFKEVGLPR